MRFAANVVLYSVLNVRYAGLVLPAGIITYLLGSPFQLVVTTGVLVGLAVAAELFTSVANGISAAHQIGHERELFADLAASAERYANGGWLNGGVEGKEPIRDEGEGPDEGEGGAPVPAER